MQTLMPHPAITSYVDHAELSIIYVKADMDLHHAISVGFIQACDFTAVASQLLSALAFLDDAGVLHGDIKPANILLFQTATKARIRYQLCDFGLATILYDPEGARLPIYTPGYRPPEVSAQRLDALCPAADIYALGVTLVNVCMRKFDYSIGWASKMLQEQRLDGIASHDAVQLMKSLVDVNYTRRPSARDALALPMFAGKAVVVVTSPQCTWKYPKGTSPISGLVQRQLDYALIVLRGWPKFKEKCSRVAYFLGCTLFRAHVASGEVYHEDDFVACIALASIYRDGHEIDEYESNPHLILPKNFKRRVLDMVKKTGAWLTTPLKLKGKELDELLLWSNAIFDDEDFEFMRLYDEVVKIYNKQQSAMLKKRLQHLVATIGLVLPAAVVPPSGEMLSLIGCEA